MATELYRKEYQKIDETFSREMVIQLLPLPGSKKIGSVHISPVTIEKCDGYKMQLTKAGDRCIRLPLSKGYVKSNQWGAMTDEIKKLARLKLFNLEAFGDSETEAFFNAVDYLASSEKLRSI